MDKNRLSDKIKEGISIQEIEDFTRKHTTEVFSVVALIVGAISSMFDFFTGPSWTIFFTTISCILAVFFPAPVERGLKQLYSFTFKQEKTTEMIIGGVKVVLALFVPFLYFSLIGLLAGTSFHYYIRHAQILKENRPSHLHRHISGDEHD